MVKHLTGLSSSLPLPLFSLVPYSPSLTSYFVLPSLSIFSPLSHFPSPYAPFSIALQFALFWELYSTPCSFLWPINFRSWQGFGVLVDTSHPNCSRWFKYFLSKAQNQASLKIQLGKQPSIQRVLRASNSLFVVKLRSFH